MRAITINLREDQYTAIEKIAVERGHEGKMSKAVRSIVDEWIEWDRIRTERRMRRDHDRS